MDSDNQIVVDTKPVNIVVMDVDKFIRERGAMRVTSAMIREPSSMDFHPEGLFSETIFGQIGATDRMLRFGFIELNCTIISPIVYRAIVKSSAFYEDIMRGKQYAYFDTVTKNLVRYNGDPDDPPKDAVTGQRLEVGTGYSFFLRYFHDIDFVVTDSQSRKNRVEIIDKYKDRCLYQRFVVIPAGIRDIQMNGDRLVQDEINELYGRMLRYATHIPAGSQHVVYDSVRYSIQMAALEIFNYLENIQTGKRGFVQGSYGSRRIVSGTRNVISAPQYDGLTPDDPQVIKFDETMVGLFQAAKMFQPHVVHGIRSIITDPIFGSAETSRISAVDPDTKKLEYIDIPATEKILYTTPVKIDGWINRFRNRDVRNAPITIKDRKGKVYWMVLVYDTGKRIYFFRSIDDFVNQYKGRNPDLSKIRPLTWVELLYLVTYLATRSRHMTVTRYPVIGEGGTYPSKVHVVTTTPGRVVEVTNLITGEDALTLPQYPIVGAPYQDAMIVSADRLADMGGDYDGDMGSGNGLWLDSSNKEVHDFLNSPLSFSNVSRSLTAGSFTDITRLIILNMSRAA